MADSSLRFTLSWGEMKLELEGDSAAALSELQNIRANGLGHLGDFFMLRTQVGSVIRDGTSAVPPPSPSIGPVPAPPPGLRSAARYAITRFRLPASAAEAAAMAQRQGATASARPNLFGSALAGMAPSLSLDLGAVIATPAPSSIWLLDFEPATAVPPSGAKITLRGGHEGPGAPGTFLVDEAVQAQVIEGVVVNDNFVSVARTGRLATLEVALAGPLAIGLSIAEPYLELNLASPGVMGGKLQGVMSAQALKEQFSQALAVYVVGVWNNAPDSETARTLRTLLLAPRAQAGPMPTAIELAGILRDHTLIRSLLTADGIAADGSPSASVALSFSASVIGQG